jgi:SAM-dependent methyltransferase
MRGGPLIELLRGGDVRTRLSAVRAGRSAVRVAATGAALRTGLLDDLTRGPADAVGLAASRGWTAVDTLEALLQVLHGLGLVRRTGTTWRLAPRGRRILADDVVRASYEGFSGYHTGLYGEIEKQLSGGPPRRDILERGDLIARLSRAMDPFVLAALRRVVQEGVPRRVLDAGCGSGTHLAAILEAAPGATGVGVESDPKAALMARRTLAGAGLNGRAEVMQGDILDMLTEGALGEDFDLALLANVIYYLPEPERVPLLSRMGDRLAPSGRLVVVTTALTGSTFSRHFDLLLRTQHGDMGLPTTEALTDQLRRAGLVPGAARRIAAGEPLVAVVARRP